MTTFWISFALGAAVLGLIVVFFAVSIYNNLVQVRLNIEKAWGNISVLLQQRHDELLKLVDACKGYMKHEEKALTDVTKLRTDYEQAASIGQKTKVENQLNASLRELMVHVENYPDLKANQNFLQLQQRVSAIESSIADRREFFNDSVNLYNITIARFPELAVAIPLGFTKHEYLVAPDKLQQDVKLNLS